MWSRGCRHGSIIHSPEKDAKGSFYFKADQLLVGCLKIWCRYCMSSALSALDLANIVNTDVITILLPTTKWGGGGEFY